jgi:hypothetical protein
MAKDSNEPTPKLPATADLLRKLEQRLADYSNGLKLSPAQLDQIAGNYNRWLANFPTPATPISPSRMIRDELARLRELIAELKTPTPAARPAASPAPEKRKAPQVDRILQAIPECFPNDDIDGISDAVVRQKVATYLEKKGLKVPDRKTMNCAIRQYRNRIR